MSVELQFTLPDDLLAELKKEAEQSGMSVADFCERPPASISVGGGLGGLAAAL